MKKLFAILGLISALSLSLSADIYIKSKIHQDAMNVMGQSQPAKDSFSEQWIGDNQYAMISEDQTIAIDLKKNIGFVINHKAKTFTEMPLPLDMSKLLPPEAAQMASMMKMTATVAPTNETKKIGKWNCSGYNLTMSMMGMSFAMKIWASTDVPFDINTYNKKFLGYTLKSLGPMMDESVVKEMMKIKGFNISTQMEMFGSKITTEVAEISKKNPPAGIFVPPAGYTKTAR
jgi:hypothetical protein